MAFSEGSAQRASPRGHLRGDLKDSGASSRRSGEKSILEKTMSLRGAGGTGETATRMARVSAEVEKQTGPSDMASKGYAEKGGDSISNAREGTEGLSSS